jgi:recombinational DNA repair protein RecT
VPNLPTRSNGNGAAAEAPKAPKPGKDEQIRGELAAASKAIAALLGGDKAVAGFCRAAVSHWLTTRDRSDKDRAEMEAIDPKSYVKACLDAANARLLPDGRDGWIVVRKGIAAWTPSWRGLVKLMRRAIKDEGGRVESFCAEVVYRQEIEAGGFDVDKAERTIRHRPWYLFGIAEEPLWDDVVLVYAAATIIDADGNRSREFRELTRADLEQRARASGDPRSADWSDAWNKWPRSQARKSAVRALMDWLPTPDIVWTALAGSVTQETPPQPGALSLAARVRESQPILDVGAREEDAPQSRAPVEDDIAASAAAAEARDAQT